MSDREAPSAGSRLGSPLTHGGALSGPAPRFQWRFLHPRQWGVWALLGAVLLQAVLPRPLRDRFADGLGALGFRFNGKRRRFALINLALCFPHLAQDERATLARRHFRAQVGAIMDLAVLRLANARRFEQLVEVSGWEHLDAVREAGRAVIVLTCHSSALDAGGIRLSMREPLVSAFNPFKSAFANWLMFGLRTRFGVRLAEREHGLRPLIRAVRGGDVLYYIPDEDLGQRRTRFAPFFGQQKATVAALGRLARACAADVLPCYTWYDRARRRYQVRLLPPLQHAWGADLAADLACMNRALETLIELHPEQYMWAQRLFKTRPPGERSPYKR